MVERARLNKVELFPTSLHGYKLMRLEPKIIPAVMRFLETTIKLRPAEWEPRYNLIPVTVSEIQTTRHAKAAEKPAAENRKERRCQGQGWCQRSGEEGVAGCAASRLDTRKSTWLYVFILTSQRTKAYQGDVVGL